MQGHGMKRGPSQKDVTHMLKESNAIEGVYDKASISCANRAWKYLITYDSMNTQLILYAHKLLMANQTIDSKYKGRYRDVPVYIGGVRKSDPPLIIENKLKQWCHKVNQNGDPIDMHVLFEDIHPFIDGNGRMGRILLNWQRVKKDLPLLVYTEDERQEYYKLFKKDRIDKALMSMWGIK